MAPKEITLPSGATRWQIRWREPDGTQRAKNLRSKALAEKEERRILHGLDEGTYHDPTAGKIVLRSWSETWLSGAHNLKPKTLTIYQQALAHILPELGGKRLDRITDTDIDTYLGARLEAGAAPSTVHREYRTLRRMFKLAVERRRLIVSPMATVEEPRLPDDEMLFLKVAELEALAGAIVGKLTPKGRAHPETGYDSLILVAGWGGLRWGELAGLRTDCVDVPRCRVHVTRQVDPQGQTWSEPKAHSKRWVNLPESVMARVAEHLRERPTGSTVWAAPRGGPLVHSNFLGWLEDRQGNRVVRRQRGYFRPAVVAAGIDGAFRIHDLRHTACALAIKAGAHPKALQKRMGHKSIQVTLDRYGHLYDEMDAEVAAKLDDMRAEALVPHLRAV